MRSPTNTALAVLVIIALIFAIGNTAILLLQKRTVLIGGLATQQTGTARFEIIEMVSITITSSLINFSSGRVVDGFSSCTISSETDETHVCGTWENYSTSADMHPGFVIENDGNVVVNLTVRGDKNASDFVTGTNPSFKLRTDLSTDDTDPEIASCITYDTSDWVEADTSRSFVVCDTLGYANASDEVELDIRVRVPDDSAIGEHSTILTFTATEAS